MKTKSVPCMVCAMVLLAVLFLWHGPARAVTPLEADAAISSGVDNLFAFATGANANKPGGVVGVVLDGNLVFQRAYGMANVAGGIPNSVTAPFYLASASKQFTAMCVLLCQEKSLLNLNDELRLHIPELDTAFNGIKIQHLLNMISTVYDVGTGNQTYTTDSMLIRLMQEGPYGVVSAEKPVGSTMHYCNMNYLLLGIIVQRVSHKTLRQFAQDEIFAKLGMTETVIHDDPALVVANQPNGYDVTFAVWSTPTTTSPATGFTGVITTLTDLMKWHQNFYANQLGNKNQSLITLMETPGVYTSGPNIGQPVSNVSLGIPSYACGLMPDTYAGNKRVGHGGRWLGYKTNIYRYPDLNLSVFVLLNRDDQYPPFQTVADVFMNNVCFATNPPPATAQQGTLYSFKYSASGAPKPVFTLESGNFPDGIVLNSNGTLAGTPTTPGDFSGVVKATSGSKTRTQAFTIHVDAASAIHAPAITSSWATIGPALMVNREPGAIRIKVDPLGHYQLSIYTVRGNLVKVIAEGHSLVTRTYSYQPRSAGVYVVKLLVDDQLRAKSGKQNQFVEKVVYYR